MYLEAIIGSAQNDCDINRPSTNAQSFCALPIIASSISLVMTRHGCRKCKYRFLMSPDPFLEENFNSGESGHKQIIIEASSTSAIHE